MPRLPPEMNKVLPASVIDALLPGDRAYARHCPVLMVSFISERAAVSPLTQRVVPPYQRRGPGLRPGTDDRLVRRPDNEQRDEPGQEPDGHHPGPRRTGG